MLGRAAGAEVGHARDVAAHRLLLAPRHPHAHTPAGTSAKNLAHFMQGIRDGHFRRFDYGDEAEI